MAYATVEDLSARFGEAEVVRLTTPEGQDLAGIVATRAVAALAGATGTIDSYLRRRYAVPLSPVPAEIVDACCKLARYDLSFKSDSYPSEQVRLAQKGTLDWLRDLAEGRAQLAGAAPAEAGTGGGAMVSDREPMFTRDTPGGW